MADQEIKIASGKQQQHQQQHPGGCAKGMEGAQGRATIYKLPPVTRTVMVAAVKHGGSPQQ